MNRRGAGMSFIAISAFLLSTKYISAAIFGSGVLSWDQSLFDAMLEYVGHTLSTFSFLALLIGIAYLVWAEYEDGQLKQSKRSER